ncbi:helix-turn-helix domain-containing protein [Streptomyces sp. NPDC048277]|uniref:helix-turn-helix domain-containing protein n=1 Tax=Streptomyces sp. NPDC048277 TaxID=3155027 RepID=UPI0033C0AD57
MPVRSPSSRRSWTAAITRAPKRRSRSGPGPDRRLPPISDERRQFREGIRMTAAERFALGEPSSVIAKELRVSVRSVQWWRRAWDKGGPRALRSAGPASPSRLSEAPFAALEAEPARGPVAHGWPVTDLHDLSDTLSRRPAGP